MSADDWEQLGPSRVRGRFVAARLWWPSARPSGRKAEAVPRRGSRTQPRVLTLGLVLVDKCPERGTRSVSLSRVDTSMALRLSSGATFRAHFARTTNPGLKPWAQSYCPFGAQAMLSSTESR
jgi:hypothetical protein